jgi:hypothetical protein
MARRPNTQPTNIYWLIDVRPETLSKRPAGFPFYCGKTIFDVNVRLARHRRTVEKYPNRLISKWLKECGEHIRVHILEVVPNSLDWSARERHWITITRHAFPGGANTTDGGQGTPGNIHTDEARNKMSKSKRGKKLSAEHCLKLKLVRIGKKHSTETRDKMCRSAKESAKVSEYHLSQIGQKRSDETRSKISAALRGKKRKKFSAEHVAKISATLRGRVFSPEHRAKISAAKTGKKRKEFSAEARANMSAAHRARLATV